jgi:hypothetical protein
MEARMHPVLADPSKEMAIGAEEQGHGAEGQTNFRAGEVPHAPEHGWNPPWPTSTLIVSPFTTNSGKNTRQRAPI